MISRQKRPSPARTRSGGVAIAALIAAALGACAPDRAVTGSLYPYDHHNRHPIVLADAPRTLDVFVGSGRLDPRQRDDVAAFAIEYRRYGRGSLTGQVPTGTPADGAVIATLDTVRAILARSGVDGGYLAVTSYAIADPRAASAIRLSFRRTQATVASQCGLWPKDLGVSNLGADERNEPHWNLGCATQANFAAQVDDPIDLVRARSEGRIDTIRRSKTIEKLRQGEDPSISWKQDGKTSAKQQVSQ